MNSFTSNSKMKRALLFAVSAVLLLYVMRKVEYYGIRRNQSGEFAKLRVSFLEHNNYDILFLGSSRAEGQFYCPVIDSATGLKSYNLGMTGAVMPLDAASLEAYLVHSDAPKHVVVNLDLHSTSDNPDTVFNFPRYFAYLENEKLFQGLQERDQRFTLFKWLPFYSMPYYSDRYLNASLRGLLGKKSLYDDDYVSGFAPSTRDYSRGDIDTMTIPKVKSSPTDYIDEGLKKINLICRSRNINLIVVVTPLFHRMYDRVENYNEMVKRYSDFCSRRCIHFIDLSHDSVSNNPNLYSDPAHLSKYGALTFTRHFSVTLQQYL